MGFMVVGSADGDLLGRTEGCLLGFVVIGVADGALEGKIVVGR